MSQISLNILIACGSINDTLIKKLIEEKNYSVFQEAYKNGNIDLVKSFIQHGADDKDYINNALKYASFNGHLEIVKLLIEHGADIKADNNYAIRYASENGHLEIVKLLIEHGADVTVNDNWAVGSASQNGHLEVVKLLIEHGADVTGDSNYAIKYASCEDHLEIVKLLIEHGADIKADDNYAIRYASRNGHLEIVKLLIKHGADIQAISANRQNIKEYLDSLKNVCYYGMVSKTKLEIKLPELQEIIKNDKYYYVYKCQLQTEDNCYVINDLEKKIMLLKSINQYNTDNSLILGFFHNI